MFSELLNVALPFGCSISVTNDFNIMSRFTFIMGRAKPNFSCTEPYHHSGINKGCTTSRLRGQQARSCFVFFAPAELPRCGDGTTQNKTASYLLTQKKLSIQLLTSAKSLRLNTSFSSPWCDAGTIIQLLVKSIFSSVATAFTQRTDPPVTPSTSLLPFPSV